MFKEYYTKDIQRVEVNTELRDQLRKQLFVSSAAKSSRASWRALVKQSWRYSYAVGVPVMGAFFLVASIFPAQMASATDAIVQPVQHSLVRSFHVVRNAAFDPRVHNIDDKTLETIQADPNVQMVDYRRTPEGESMIVVGELPCEGDPGACSAEPLFFLGAASGAGELQDSIQNVDVTSCETNALGIFECIDSVTGEVIAHGGCVGGDPECMTPPIPFELEFSGNPFVEELRIEPVMFEVSP